MVDNFDENAETTPMVPSDETAPVPPVITATAAAPVAAGVTPAEVAPAARDVVHVPRRWLVWGGSALLAVVMLGGVFSAGVAVGHRTGGVRGGIGSTEMASPRMGVPDQGYGDDTTDGYGDGGTGSYRGSTGRQGESGGRMPGGHPRQSAPEDQDSMQGQ